MVKRLFPTATVLTREERQQQELQQRKQERRQETPIKLKNKMKRKLPKDRLNKGRKFKNSKDSWTKSSVKNLF